LKHHIQSIQRKKKDLTRIGRKGWELEVANGPVRSQFEKLKKKRLLFEKRRKESMANGRREAKKREAPKSRRALEISTLKPGIRQAGRTDGPFHLHTKRVQLRATAAYLRNDEWIKEDARAVLNKAVELSRAYFKKVDPKLDTTISNEDTEYAVDRCTQLWKTLVHSEMFANFNANMPQARVFLFVIFKCLRRGCDYPGVFTCRRVEYFATRFMDPPVVSGKGVYFEKHVSFKARILTEASAFLHLALKEASASIAAKTKSATEPSPARELTPLEKERMRIKALLESVVS
jgi:hypothetical protein